MNKSRLLLILLIVVVLLLTSFAFRDPGEWTLTIPPGDIGLVFCEQGQPVVFELGESAVIGCVSVGRVY